MPLSRRIVLQRLAAIGLLAACPVGLRSAGRGAEEGRRAVLLRYLADLARPGGGFGWEGQERAHLTPTYAVVGCLRWLGAPLPEPAALARWVRTHHPRELKKLEQERRLFDFQQVQTLVWLGDPAADLAERFAGWVRPLAYLKQYERNGHPVLQSELAAVQVRALLGLPLAPLVPAFPDYLAARQRPNGSYNNTPTAEGGDGHVLNTLAALQAAHLLGLAPTRRDALVAWLQDCQRPSGGFTLAPEPEFGGVEDVAYTAAAVRALRLLGAEPRHRVACLDWLRSLTTADGGFADRPGWQSNPLATFYALEALAALEALPLLEAWSVPPAPARVALPAGLKIWSIQLEALGRGSPAEAVALAASLRLDWWGAKNARPEWIARAQALAEEQRVPVRFFAANEEYGTWVQVPGLGTYSHTSDILVPPGGDPGPALANQGAVSWAEFRRRRLEPLQQAGGRLVWQFGENEALVRMFLDDSLARGGFAAISTFHFGNPDFTNSEPFLHRWRGRIPFVSLQDAHGEEPWWLSELLTGHRTLFLAEAPTWAGWLEALRRGWVVAVRHDAVSRGETWLHAGSAEVASYVREREAEWRWWGEAPRARRPLVSVVALTPTDAGEVGRPERGRVLRVRWAWACTNHGQPQTPLVDFVRLTLDGREVATRLVETRRAKGPGLGDCYRWAEVPPLAAGAHQATATVRRLADGREEAHTLVFAT